MGKFCILGHTGWMNPSAYKRTWYESREEAVTAAEEMVRKQNLSTGKFCSVLIVEAVQVVEAGVPQVSSRSPTEEDTPSKEKSPDGSSPNSDEEDDDNDDLDPSGGVTSPKPKTSSRPYKRA